MSAATQTPSPSPTPQISSTISNLISLDDALLIGFRSYAHPLASETGAMLASSVLLALFITGSTPERGLVEGMIMIVGIVAKNGMLVAYEAHIKRGKKRSEIQVGPNGEKLKRPE